MPTWSDVLACAQTLEDSEESTSYNTPALKVRKRLFVRLREDGLTIAIRARAEDRAALPRLNPTTFSIPEHYARSDFFVIHLPSVNPLELAGLVKSAHAIARAQTQESKRRKAP